VLVGAIHFQKSGFAEHDLPENAASIQDTAVLNLL
jgi:hypothetical protein